MILALCIYTLLNLRKNNLTSTFQIFQKCDKNDPGQLLCMLNACQRISEIIIILFYLSTDRFNST